MFLLVLEVIKKMLSIWLLNAGFGIILILLILGVCRVVKFAVNNSRPVTKLNKK
jgi:hypothetical protein